MQGNVDSEIGGVAFFLGDDEMPKVGNGEIHFPKGMSKIDKGIVQKIIDIKDCEKKLLEVKQEICSTRKVLLNLQTLQGTLEDTIRKEQDELFDLYDDKVFRCTVAFNR